MYDAAKCLFLSGSITALANVPELFELPLEKIGFGTALFLVIWMYMKHILPKTQEDIDIKNKRIEELILEIHKFGEQREADQNTIADLLQELRTTREKVFNTVKTMNITEEDKS